MEISTVVPSGRQHVQGYFAGGFTISGVRHQGAILVLAERTMAWATPARPDLIGLEALRGELAGLDILVVGTGSGFRPVDAGVAVAVRAWGPVIEAMDTPAACRTYNLLLAEGRRVAAALLPTG